MSLLMEMKTTRIRFLVDTAVDFDSIPRGMVGRLQLRPRTEIVKGANGKMEMYIKAGTEFVLADFVGSGCAEIVK